MNLMLGAVRAHSTDVNKFKTDCPFCGKEKHFHFDLKTKRGICFVCMSKSIYLDDKTYFDRKDSPLVNQEQISIKERINKVFTRPSYNLISIDIDQFSEPVHPKLHPMSYKYLTEKRGFTRDEIRRLDIRSGKSYFNNEDRLIKKWTGRVIFPFYEQGICTYAIGRTYVDDDRKYVNVDVPKTNIVYGIDTIVDRECIICEGLISAIAAEKYSGVSAVCLLGKTISDTQLAKIRNKADRVWLSLDGGVPETQIRAASRKLLKAGFSSIYRIDLPEDDDPDELGDDYRIYFDRAKKVNYL